MNRENIENLEELLVKTIGTKKIATTRISRLTAPGDNYGGLLLKVDATLEDSEGTREDLHVVAKCIPINTFMQKLFDIQVTVKKEIAFYGTLVPLLRQFQREQGVEDVTDIFPKLYESRLNLIGSDIVDENSAILMEDLNQSGYKNVNRMVGFDLETAKLVLKDLADFHSSFLALKLTKMEMFEEKISPYLTPRRIASPRKMPGNGAPVASPIDMLKEFLQNCEEIRHLLPKLKDILELNPEKFVVPTASPFFTVTHGDMWVNNIMVKFENDKPVESKFVDFQGIELGSPVRDLLFLLMSSVQQSVLDEHLDDLIKYYHEMFVENLIQHKCDPTPYTFEQLLEEIRTHAKATLGHSIFMVLFVVFSKMKRAINEEDPSEIPNFGTVDDITPESRERVIFLVSKCDDKGWL